jgi:hypothetical protein
VDPFAALALDWQARATDKHSRRAIVAWAEAAPPLAGFTSPAELVADINKPGHPVRSCTLLAELLVVADADRLAARATLQAVIPGLHRATTRRWPKARVSGPWSSHHELGADTIGAAWEAIQLHAGERLHRPAATVIRHVEGRLRQAHVHWTSTDRTTAKPPEPRAELSQSSLDAALTPEQQAIRVIGEAVRCGIIDSTQAALLASVGVLGHRLRDSAPDVGLSEKSAYGTLHSARLRLRTWLGVPDKSLSMRSHLDVLIFVPQPRRYQVCGPAAAPLDNDGHESAATATGQLLATGASA